MEISESELQNQNREQHDKGQVFLASVSVTVSGVKQQLLSIVSTTWSVTPRIFFVAFVCLVIWIIQDRCWHWLTIPLPQNLILQTIQPTAGRFKWGSNGECWLRWSVENSLPIHTAMVRDSCATVAARQLHTEQTNPLSQVNMGENPASARQHCWCCQGRMGHHTRMHQRCGNTAGYTAVYVQTPFYSAVEMIKWCPGGSSTEYSVSPSSPFSNTTFTFSSTYYLISHHSPLLLSAIPFSATDKH